MGPHIVAFLTSWPLLLAYGAIQIGFILRALLRPNREPSSRMAWLLVMMALPAFGILAYVLFGETNIGSRRAARYREMAEVLRNPDTPPNPCGDFTLPSAEYLHLFRTGESINGFGPVGGNRAELLADSEAAIRSIVADIDAAQDHVHVLFYIWLADRSGLAVVEALIRAAGRGVIVRAMADDIGSRKMIRSEHWARMKGAGVRLARALPVSNPVLHPIRGRMDLRNHRKIVVIDKRITYCGSQNCADAEFLPKKKYGPWVDLMLRFEGPVVRQNQWLFAEDWMAHHEDDLRDLIGPPSSELREPGITAQVIGTGPTVRPTAMPEVFEALMHGAREELVLTTPYYVPTEPMQSALCSAARRGVRTILVLPERNDSFVVAAASRSYYVDLLKAGVQIYEYTEGLLHAKSLTLDGRIALIGSANLDRRSFELNYENNILLEDRGVTAQLRARQQSYIDVSDPVTAKDVTDWGLWQRAYYNTIAMMGPVL
ncbi:cardiolipin synthase [Pseudooceanicola nanhaiensis]|uniref:cardiolipin synthase n=1 Tax=Pseudooceanicola nanhaiensis TaxID=375761 RepID=UPI001CD28CA7|nr:cardiolipin synthase [Pseudooceanicola nanhaiensis]MCA0921506.1 cardiolipin synthase [Pseudooceanicola nanhaiensis]